MHVPHRFASHHVTSHQTRRPEGCCACCLRYFSGGRYLFHSNSIHLVVLGGGGHDGLFYLGTDNQDKLSRGADRSCRRRRTGSWQAKASRYGASRPPQPPLTFQRFTVCRAARPRAAVRRWMSVSSRAKQAQRGPV